MPNPMVDLVEKDLAAFRKLRLTHPTLFPQNNRLYPISFFGDVRRAEVVTLALNPAYPEFSEDRRWPINDGPDSLTPLGLTNRLLCYFHTQTPPHKFFIDCEKALSVIGCSYKSNAAHIDVHPFPTKFQGELTPPEPATLAGIIEEQSVRHLNSVLQIFDRLKLIIVVDFAVPVVEGGWIITCEYVRRRLTCLSGLTDENCLNPPLLRGGGRAEIASYFSARQDDLQSFLRTAPCLIFSP